MLDIHELLSRHARSIETLLVSEIPPGSVPHISDGVWYQFSSGGKRLRPALCLITCEALGGDPADAMPFALATEILHNFLLIHDDIEDGDTMRRDKETLWKKVGIPNAINIADYLIAKAYQLILRSRSRPEARVRLAEIFTETFVRTVEGQALDINLRGSPQVMLDTYFRIVQLKTAYYLALTWVGGAVIAGVAESALDSLWELGRCLGPAFQIRDDLIDMSQGKGRGGEVGCDLREGKPSIFFAYVQDRKKGSDGDRRKLVEIVAKPREETETAEVEWAIGFYERVGAIHFAEEEANRLIQKAQLVIESIPLNEAGKEVFRAVSRFMVDRNT